MGEQTKGKPSNTQRSRSVLPSVVSVSTPSAPLSGKIFFTSLELNPEPRKRGVSFPRLTE